MVYALVLVYTCRIALSRTFGESYSKSLGTVVGIMLAVSLSIAGTTLGFTLRSFGPIAAMIILLVFGLVIYSLMRHVGAGHAACGSLAFIVTFFSIRAVSPGIFVWAEKNQWAGYLDSFLLLSVLVAIIRVVSAGFSSDGVSSLKDAMERMAGSSNHFVDFSGRQTALESSIVRKDMKKLTRHGRRECRHVIGNLRQIINMLKQHGANRNVAAKAYESLQNLRQGEHEITAELAKIQAIDEKLLRFDLSRYRDLEQAYSRFTDQQKTQCKRLFAQERDKIGVEKVIRELAVRSESYAMKFNRCIETAGQCLKSVATAEAIQWLEKALAEETLAERIIADIRKNEKILVRLMRQQMASLTRLKQ